MKYKTVLVVPFFSFAMARVRLCVTKNRLYLFHFLKLSHDKAFHSNLSPAMKPGEAEDISEVTNLILKEGF